MACNGRPPHHLQYVGNLRTLRQGTYCFNIAIVINSITVIFVALVNSHLVDIEY